MCRVMEARRPDLNPWKSQPGTAECSEAAGPERLPPGSNPGESISFARCARSVNGLADRSASAASGASQDEQRESCGVRERFAFAQSRRVHDFVPRAEPRKTSHASLAVFANPSRSLSPGEYTYKPKPADSGLVFIF